MERFSKNVYPCSYGVNKSSNIYNLILPDIRANISKQYQLQKCNKSVIFYSTKYDKIYSLYM
jgi:hypothetical protein